MGELLMAGDVVMLVSGGPPMAVSEDQVQNADGVGSAVHCTWMDREGHVHGQVFAVKLLTKISPEIVERMRGRTY